MKKPLSILLALCMALTLLPAAALAEGSDPVATVETAQQEQTGAGSEEKPPLNENEDLIMPLSQGGPNVATLLPAEQAGTITMTEDVKLPAAFSVANNKTLKLDLNGYTLTGPDGTYGYTIDNGGDLTIVDNSVGKTGKIVAATVASATIRNNRTMKLEGITVESAFIAVKSEQETSLTVVNCKLSTSTDEGCCLQNWGSAEVSETTMSGNMGIMAVSYSEGSTAYSSTLTLTNVTVGGAVSLDSGRFDDTTATQTVTINGGSYTGTVRVSSGSIMEIKGGASIVEAVVSNNASYSLGNQVHTSIGPSHVKIAEGVTVTSITAPAKTGDVYYSSINDAVASGDFDGTVTMYCDTNEDVVIPQGKTVTLDLNSCKLMSKQGDAINNKGALTVKGPGTVQCDLAGKSALLNDVGGTATLDGGSFKKELNVSSDDYYVITNHGTLLTINDGVAVVSTSTHSSAIENGWYTPSANVGEANSNLVINGGSVSASGGLYTIKNDDYGVLTIHGGTFTNTAPENGTVLNWNDLTITGGTFNAANCSVATMAEGTGGTPAHPTYEKGKTVISNGYFTGALGTDSGKVHTAITVTVSGGLFTEDPGAYAAADMVSTASGNAAYPYTVVAKSAAGIPVKPVEGAPKVPAAENLPAAIPVESREAVANAAASVTAPAPEAANAVINGITDEKAAELKQAALDSGLAVSPGGTVTIYVRTVMAVEPTAYTPADGTLVLDITPKYELVASTAASAQGVKEENSEVVQAAVELPVSTPVEVSLTLPAGYTTETGTGKVYVQHQKGGITYVYDATVVDAGGGAYTATFTNPHGFSTFTITKAEPQAKIGESAYAALQDAVDAVTGGQTVTALANGSATVSGNKTFTVNTDGHSVTLTAAGGYDLSKNTNGNLITCTVSAHHSSGGTSMASTYAITVEKTDGGVVTASRARAAKGSTVTLTVKPDDGYELDELTATDKGGDDVKISNKDGKNTFTMPASAVIVKASFRSAVEQKEFALPFTDVDAGDWYYDAVQFVYDKGMMTGTTNASFSPDTAITRGMIVTILYRLEGEPAVAGAGFPDVAAGQYYSSAVAWAAEESIVTGYSDGRFGADDPITREQLAVILYRYAGSPDTAGMVLSEFEDAGQISAFATDAMRWAAGQGLILGKGSQRLDPMGTADRAQTAAILMRFCEKAYME